MVHQRESKAVEPLSAIRGNALFLLAQVVLVAISLWGTLRPSRAIPTEPTAPDVAAGGASLDALEQLDHLVASLRRRIEQLEAAGGRAQVASGDSSRAAIELPVRAALPVAADLSANALFLAEHREELELLIAANHDSIAAARTRMQREKAADRIAADHGLTPQEREGVSNALLNLVQKRSVLDRRYKVRGGEALEGGDLGAWRAEWDDLHAWTVRELERSMSARLAHSLAIPTREAALGIGVLR